MFSCVNHLIVLYSNTIYTTFAGAWRYFYWWLYQVYGSILCGLLIRYSPSLIMISGMLLLNHAKKEGYRDQWAFHEQHQRPRTWVVSDISQVFRARKKIGSYTLWSTVFWKVKILFNLWSLNLVLCAGIDSTTGLWKIRGCTIRQWMTD